MRIRAAAALLIHAATAATLLAGLALGTMPARGAANASPPQTLRSTQDTMPLPRLSRNDGIAQMIVDGQPYLMVAGELHNSTASSSEYMRPIWEKLVDLHLNTVIGTASWELVEPAEGIFDFSAVDSEIEGAREHGLHLVLIWFGAWKNASSSYAPIWVKPDPARFPRAARRPGSASLSSFGDAADALSPFGNTSVDADAQAFRALMRHIRTIDTDHTVIMVQVENEVGVLGTSRDHSPLAEAAWSRAVPAALIRYLAAHKSSLSPELSAAWGAHDFKQRGTWAEVFGTGASADEIFMAWAFGRAIERIAAAGKQELPIPLYVNAWLGPQPGETTPGQFPSGGPVPGMLDVWRAAAPALDLFAPDIYLADFQGVCASYVRSGNPLFIPEARANIANLFWAVGHDHALGYSPFGIEDLAADRRLAAAYETLRALAPLILTNAPAGRVITVMKDDPATMKAFQRLTGLAIRFTDTAAGGEKNLPPAPNGTMAGNIKPDDDPRGFALVIATGPSEFIIAGSDVVITSATAHIGSVDEMLLRQNRLIPGRRLNGDEQYLATHLIPSPDAIQVRQVVTYTTR